MIKDRIRKAQFSGYGGLVAIVAASFNWLGSSEVSKLFPEILLLWIGIMGLSFAVGLVLPVHCRVRWNWLAGVLVAFTLVAVILVYVFSRI